MPRGDRHLCFNSLLASYRYSRNQDFHSNIEIAVIFNVLSEMKETTLQFRVGRRFGDVGLPRKLFFRALRTSPAAPLYGTVK